MSRQQLQYDVQHRQESHRQQHVGNCASVSACHACQLNLRQCAMAARYTRSMPRTLRAALPAALLACSALLVACSAASPRLADRQPASSADASAVIYVVKRAWHVDIGFATADLQWPLA